MGAAPASLAGLTPDQVIQKIAEYFHRRHMGIKDAFRWLDQDGSGYVTWEEFLKGAQLCLDGLGGANAVDPSSLFPVFSRFDVDGDGRMSIQEFASAFNPASPFGSSWTDVDYYTTAKSRNLIPGGPISYPRGVRLRGEQLTERMANEVVERIASSLVRTGHTPQELFAKLDRDRNGRLSRRELEEVIVSLQPDLSLAERDSVFEHFDRSRRGSVDLLEFQAALQGVNAGALVAVEDKVQLIRQTFLEQGYTLYESFSVFDRDGNGFLSREEWIRAMTALGLQSTLSPSDLEAVFRRFDSNGDGYMSITEFQEFFDNALDRRFVFQHGEWPTYQPPPVEEPWEAEILDLVRTCLSVGRSGMSITEVWRRLDVDRNNAMSFYEFQRMVTTYRPELTQQAVEALFYKVNTSQTGTISMSEFIRRFG